MESLENFMKQMHCVISVEINVVYIIYIDCPYVPTQLRTCSKHRYLNTYLLTYLLTYSTEQSTSWETNRFSANQEIPRILWNPKVHYCNHKCPPPVPILSQLDSVHTRTPNVWISVLILSSHLCFLSFFPPKLCIRISLPDTCYVPCPSYFSLFITRTILGEECSKHRMCT